MPEAARAQLPGLRQGPTVEQVHAVARTLKQQSRFLCRQSDRLRGRSNDLLTVAMFQRRHCQATRDACVSYLRLIP